MLLTTWGVKSLKQFHIIISKLKESKEVGFIREVRYTDWLTNIVLVKKQNVKWKMCVDSIDLNKH